jgi:hypothetical protein
MFDNATGTRTYRDVSQEAAVYLPWLSPQFVGVENEAGELADYIF